MRTVILIGGSGYIGGFLLRTLLSANKFDFYMVYDLKELKGFDNEIASGKVRFINADVRKLLPVHKIRIDKENSWIFNFAAVHREPGHAYEEYFDTNIPGAEHTNVLARELGIKNIFFTSSIAPYGKSLRERQEDSSLYPETAYGISKLLAEKIHKEWLAEDKTRRLIIVRPSVIYGPNDPGNVYRMIKAQKKGTFVLPDGGRVIKAYGYVYGLVDSILFVMNKKDRFILYNYAENPLENLESMTKIVKEEFGYNKIVVKVPVWLLIIIASIIQVVSKLIGWKSDIHPVRVRKAGFPTNIKPLYLINQNFKFKYSFRESLIHWRKINPNDFES